MTTWVGSVLASARSLILKSRFPRQAFPSLPLCVDDVQSPTSNSSPATEKRNEGIASETAQAGYLADLEEDPRNTMRTCQSARGPRDEKTNFMNSLIRRYLHSGGYISSQPRYKAPTRLLSGFTGASPIIQRELPPGADAHEVDAFSRRQGPGPTSEKILIFWGATMKHSWNKAAIRLMEHEFLEYAKKNHLPDIVAAFGEGCLTASTADIDKMLKTTVNINHSISTRLAAHRSSVQAASRELTSARRESPHNYSMVLMEKRISAATRNRRYERRAGLHLRRGMTIQRMVCNTNLDQDTHDLWKMIQSVYSHLMNDDMSSDETDVEGVFASPKIVRRVQVDWLAEEVSKILHFVDRHYQPQGNTPLPRIWQHIHVDKKSFPKPNLPLNLYSIRIQNDADMLKSLQPKPAIDLPNVPEPKGFPSDGAMEMEAPINWNPSSTGMKAAEASLETGSPMEGIQS